MASLPHRDNQPHQHSITTFPATTYLAHPAKLFDRNGTRRIGLVCKDILARRRDRTQHVQRAQSVHVPPGRRRTTAPATRAGVVWLPGPEEHESAACCRAV